MTHHISQQVICSGDGLRLGTLGRDIRSFIDTRKAGPGELSLHCVGPTGKTAYCELNDHQDGTFTLNLKPQVHTLKPQVRTLKPQIHTENYIGPKPDDRLNKNHRIENI